MLKHKLNWNADVALMHNEIKVKDNLVYNRANGGLNGFVESRDLNSTFNNNEAVRIDTVAFDRKHTAIHVICLKA